MASSRCMPDPLQERVFAAVSNSAHPEALLHLACVNKAFAAQLRQPSADVWWEAAWACAKRKRPAAATEEQKANPALSIKTRDKLRLAGFNGCMLCGAKSVRKVYWEFSIRCCKDCLTEHSLAENTLKHTFHLQPSTFQHLPHREVQMYKLAASHSTPTGRLTYCQSCNKSIVCTALKSTLSVNSNNSRSKRLRDRIAKTCCKSGAD